MIVGTKVVREGSVCPCRVDKEVDLAEQKNMNPPEICRMNPFIHLSNPISKHLIIRQYEVTQEWRD